MNEGVKYTVKYRKIHTDTIAGVRQAGVSEYQMDDVALSQLPKVIVEITEKSYELIRITRTGMV